MIAFNASGVGTVHAKHGLPYPTTGTVEVMIA